MKLIVVYNTCGIKGKDRDNENWYKLCIQSLLEQDLPNCRVVWSSCLNDWLCRKTLHNTFGEAISYCYVDEVVPVNVSFNYAVQRAVEHFGRTDGYVYVDSGVTFYDEGLTAKQGLSHLYKYLQDDEVGMVTAQVDNDSGFQQFFGVDSFSEDFRVPLGSTCNLHVTLFPHYLYEMYNGRLIPDIFASYCTESIFSFITAAIGRKWIIAKDLVLHHEKSVDGASAGFPQKHDQVYLINRSIHDIISTDEAQECGLGYEEWRGLLMHNPEAFDEKGFAKTDRLYRYLCENFYLPDEVLNYNDIAGTFIP